jgi:hypothetical protein
MRGKCSTTLSWKNPKSETYGDDKFHIFPENLINGFVEKFRECVC